MSDLVLQLRRAQIGIDGYDGQTQRIQRQNLDRAGNWINGFRPASVE